MAIMMAEEQDGRLPYKRLPSLSENGTPRSTNEEDLPGYVPLPRDTDSLKSKSTCNLSTVAVTQQPMGSAVVLYTKDADGKLQEEVSIKSGTCRTHTTSIDDFDKIEDLPEFFEKSVEVRCPRCNIKGNSVTKRRPGLGMLGHMGLLCAVGLIPVFFLPLFCRKTYDTVHYCSVCDTKLGRYYKKTCMNEDDLLELDR